MPRRVTGALAVAVLFAASAQADAETLSLREALATAYATNPQLEAQRAALRGVDENVAQANAGYRPTLSFQGSYGFENTQVTLLQQSPFSPTVTEAHTIQHNLPVTGAIVLSQPLFRGGRTFAEVRRAKAQVHAGIAQLGNVEEGVLLDAATAYMDVVRDAASVALRRQNVTALAKQLADTQEEFKVGEVTRTDVAQAQARLAQAQADLTTTIGQLQISRSNFEHFVGRPALILEEHPRYPGLPAALEPIVTESLANNPFVLSAKEEEKAAQYAVDDAAGQLMPQASVQAQYQYLHDQPNTGQGFSFASNEHVGAIIGQVTVPIYQGGAEYSAVRQAEQQDAQAKLNIADAQRQVADAARTAWQSYTAAVASIKTNQAQAQADTVALDGVKQEQQVGTRTVLDVLNAEQELLNAQLAVVVSEHNAEVAAFQTLSAMGKLTARDLALPTQLYDPNRYYDENAGRWIGTDDD